MKCPKQAGAHWNWNQLLLPSQVNRTWNEGVEGMSFVNFGKEGNMGLVLRPLNTNQYGLEMPTLHPYLLHTSCFSLPPPPRLAHPWSRPRLELNNSTAATINRFMTGKKRWRACLLFLFLTFFVLRLYSWSSTQAGALQTVVYVLQGGPATCRQRAQIVNSIIRNDCSNQFRKNILWFQLVHFYHCVERFAGAS